MPNTLKDTDVGVPNVCSPVDWIGVERGTIRFPIEIRCVADSVQAVYAVAFTLAPVGTASAYQGQSKHADLGG